ncbi:hypothetical protein BDZ97DRAFT_1075269 [Flammula alnicola]|nr:hypothetical protein BDZ97DRAFT_1075269 [Flammula alnicola]
MTMYVPCKMTSRLSTVNINNTCKTGVNTNMQNQSASINHLPVELHTSILKFFFSISHLMRFLSIQEYWRLGRWVYFDQEAPASSKRRPDIERELRSILLFPFNVASVSRLWHDILVRIPEYWTQVVFDVANDPTPFLNAFSWSKILKGSRFYF